MLMSTTGDSKNSDRSSWRSLTENGLQQKVLSRDCANHVSVDAFSGSPVFVPRALDVNKGQMCWIIGTVYMDMPLKDNVLVDLEREVRLHRISDEL